MNADQFNRALEKLGLTSEGNLAAGRLTFAKIIAVNPRTVGRWALGESEVPTAIAMLLNLMIKTNTKPEKLKE